MRDAKKEYLQPLCLHLAEVQNRFLKSLMLDLSIKN